MRSERRLTAGDWLMLLVCGALLGIPGGFFGFAAAFGGEGPLWALPLLGIPLPVFLIRRLPFGARSLFYVTAVVSGFAMLFHAASGYSS